MNYANHNLRTSLQEWKNRLYKAPHNQFGHQLRYFFDNINSNLQIKGILEEITKEHNYTDEVFNQLVRGAEKTFKSDSDQAAFTYQFLTFFINKYETYDIHNYTFFSLGDSKDTTNSIIENYISPIIYFLHDILDKSNSTIYLLEKYKKRTEWFTKKELFERYDNATKNYEQILEDDLRLFLFDQGIEYPFSTPTSASGRADIIGQIETDNPLVVEIKIFDRKKGYGKDRIKDGFTQIVDYANDYGKDIGYLVIYNMDKAELNLNFSEKNKIFPPRIIFNNKTFYFIIIKSGKNKSASKAGKIEEIEILEKELTDK